MAKTASSGKEGVGGVGGRSASRTARADNTINSLEKSGLPKYALEDLQEGMRPLRAHLSAYEGKSANAVAMGQEAPANSVTGKPFAPIEINVTQGSGRSNISIQDGRHRLAAAVLSGATRIRARVRVSGSRGGAIKSKTIAMKVPKKGSVKIQKRTSGGRKIW